MSLISSKVKSFGVAGFALISAVTFGGCQSGGGGGGYTYYQPSTYCQDVQYCDMFGCWYDTECYYYSQSGQTEVTRDVVADVANADQILLEKAGEFYAQKLNVSADQGMRIARLNRDFKAVENRTQKDLEQFAQSLYGVDPAQMVAAVAAAQLGDQSKLDGAIAQAAKTFDTSPENMKKIVHAMNGDLLKQYGIELK